MMYVHDQPNKTPRRDPLIGVVLGDRFRVDDRLAAGGFGAVYRGSELATGAEVAVKVLHKDLARDASAVARFRREGDTLCQLRDPHTVTAIARGESADGTMYIAMELLHGESLDSRFRANGTMPWRRVARIARAVCSSLAEAHALGVVHRDLKPANIHLERRGDEREFVKVVDFGIAKLLTPDAADLTHAGQMIGTFDYMSPEQMVGGMCTGRSDIYTLAVVMYEMISGVRPFGEVNGPTGLLAAMLTKRPRALTTLAIIPAELDRLVMRCLEREQQLRPKTVQEVARVLDDLLHDDEADAVTHVVTSFDAAELGLAESNTRLGRADTEPSIDGRSERTVDDRPATRIHAQGTSPPPARGSAPVTVQPQIVTPSLPHPQGIAWAQPPVAAGFPMPTGTPVVPMPIVPQPTAPVVVASMPPMPPTRSLVVAPRYDITEAARHDAAVRRIVWLCLLVVALVIVAFVASHL
jgi:serine/threonine protein kinase